MSPNGRRRFADARVARLGTVDAAGRPHVVPFTFAVAGDVIYTAVDHKPKRTRTLKRIDNIRANPAVCALADHYDDDWARLWWIRLDGRAQIVQCAEPETDPVLGSVSAELRAKYPQYRETPLYSGAATLIRVAVASLSSWCASEAAATGPTVESRSPANRC